MPNQPFRLPSQQQPPQPTNQPATSPPAKFTLTQPPTDPAAVDPPLAGSLGSDAQPQASQSATPSAAMAPTPIAAPLTNPALGEAPPAQYQGFSQLATGVSQVSSAAGNLVQAVGASLNVKASSVLYGTGQIKQAVVQWLLARYRAIQAACSGSQDCISTRVLALSGAVQEIAQSVASRYPGTSPEAYRIASDAVITLANQGSQALQDWERQPGLPQPPGSAGGAGPAQPYAPPPAGGFAPAAQIPQCPPGTHYVTRTGPNGEHIAACVPDLPPPTPPLPPPPQPPPPNPVPPQPPPGTGGIPTVGPMPVFSCDQCAALPPLPSPPAITPSNLTIDPSNAVQVALQQQWDQIGDPCFAEIAIPGYGGGSVATIAPNGLVKVESAQGGLPGYGTTGGAVLQWALLSYLHCKCAAECPTTPPTNPPPTPSPTPPASGGTGNCPTVVVHCDQCKQPKPKCKCPKPPTKKTKPPTTTAQWCVYRSAQSGQCYAVSSKAGPEDPEDEKLACYGNETEANIAAEQCQVVTPPISYGPITVGEPLPGGIWCDPAICSEIDTMTLAFDIQLGMSSPILQMMGGQRIYNEQDINNFGKKFPYGTQWIAEALYGPVYSVAWLIGQGVNLVRAADSGLSPVWWSLTAWRALLRLASIPLGASATEAAKDAEQWQRYIYPRELPTADQATRAYLTDSIDQVTWRCWTRANNQCDGPAEKIVDSSRSKLGVGELVQLRRRGRIEQAEYNQRIRQLGFLNPSEADEYYALGEQIPPVSELIRMMVRDAADEGLVSEFGMDADFTTKWSGKLKEWGKQQGISDEYAQYEWRSHWSIPSPGQLYEMFHRLRNLPAGDPNRVTEEQIKTALEQQDILPFWIDKFLAISFRPLTRIDTGRAYDIGALDFDATVRAYLNLGYDDDNARTMATFKRKQLEVRLRNDPIVKRVSKGLLPRQSAADTLAAQGIDPAAIAPALDYAELAFKQSTVAVCVSSLRKRYMLAEFDDAVATANLVGQGLTAGQAAATVDGWRCARDAIAKQAPASTLCKWFKSGLIPKADYLSRLKRLHFPDDQADLLVAQCEAEIAEAKAKAEAQKLKQERAAKQNAARQAARNAQQTAKQAEKVAKAAFKNLKLTKALQNDLVTASIRMAGKWGQSEASTAQTVFAAYDYLVLQIGLEKTDAVKIIKQAASSITSKEQGEFDQVIIDAGQAQLEAYNTSVVDGSLGT